jgi:hypothetical protein
VILAAELYTLLQHVLSTVDEVRDVDKDEVYEI